MLLYTLVLVLCASIGRTQELQFTPTLPSIPKPWPSYPNLPAIPPLPQWPFPKSTSSKSMQSFTSPHTSYSVFSHNYPVTPQTSYTYPQTGNNPSGYRTSLYGSQGNIPDVGINYGNVDRGYIGSNVPTRYGAGRSIDSSGFGLRNFPEVGINYGNVDRSYSSSNFPTRYGAGRALDSSGFGYQANNFPIGDLNGLGQENYPGMSQFDQVGIEQGFGQNQGNYPPGSNIQRIPPANSYKRINGRVSFNEPIVRKFY